ncbi:MAG: Glycine betaine uptake system ATP-binding protein YehX [Pantoea stewartii]|uniref:ABC transporter ATP-binding protein n=1 Tax=Pantoea stewartii TaxID=66269 RepID=UPI0024BE4C4F|nr:ABC transporter ATP-binding protein [Pantoea stewartii]WHS97592.1 MAG: Glycine betaine uptake system ATP-binding protein YehX [Pantoea stewartii]
MIEFERVTKYFAGQAAVKNLSLTLAEGSFSVLLGTSGSGKSTMLKMINRLVEYDQGDIRFRGTSIRQLDAQALRRQMGYAIQSTGLFPHWTIEKNIATVPALLGWPNARRQARIAELITLLNLDPALLRRYPHQLSGGQQQRVGVARALAADPQVLLMDEPFGALDPVTRSALQQEMLRIHQVSGCTIVLVTHDIDEALTLADNIVLLHDGEIVQQGKPLTLLTRPGNDFVRDFFGRSERGLRLLALGQVGSVVRHGEWLEAEPLRADLTLREALSQFISRGTDKLPVVDGDHRPLGVLHFADLLHHAETGRCDG